MSSINSEFEKLKKQVEYLTCIIRTMVRNNPPPAPQCLSDKFFCDCCGVYGGITKLPPINLELVDDFDPVYCLNGNHLMNCCKVCGNWPRYNICFWCRSNL